MNSAMPEEKSMAKERADKLLVRRGLVETREKAQRLIMAGLVFAGTERVDKAGQSLEVDRELSVKDKLPFVSRAGAKLAQALDEFGINPAGKIAADIGASTGGFTDCLLQRGAKKVFAVDVDTNQLDWTIRRDPRVILIEKNARYLSPADLPEVPDIVTVDVSFISILKVLPALAGVMGPEAILVALIKPQFEAGRPQVGKNGIVRDPLVHADVLDRILRGALGSGFGLLGLARCTTRGQKGNVEFLAHFRRQEPGPAPENLLGLIKEVAGDE
jgi:23S rRNA (cytidine1920-2'-O)/16S rRNA (cytidine1409-2'-O)-methyltransferase